ncbi:hypothetical protein [Croceicoccus estronivorus]|uniref:hypothetical protein n=1 Tax=Croceicoccus estronivorus TaxID=1172626 RepID=UPI00147815E0|nr:hypothetical protein [Croceicoccus estronivorus]
MSARGTLRHTMPGRIRIVLDHPLPARDHLQWLASALATVENVQEVEIRPRSGSVIIHHVGEYDTLVDKLDDAGLTIETALVTDAAADPIGQVVERLSQADAVLKKWSGGKADIWNVVFSALVAGGFIQLARGRVAGPALTLFGQAATLAMSRPLRRFLG